MGRKRRGKKATEVLAMHSSGDRPAEESTKTYVMGFIMTLLAAVLYGIILLLVELVYKIKQEITFATVLEIQVKLKPYMKTSIYDTNLAEEWTLAMSTILEWLAPLAHNMIRWQSERSFEQHSFVSRTNVLLVQTLYFANQEKIEETIIELLVGLNYVWRSILLHVFHT
ncbi:unnamed protein product [Lupinus luteus]|uniref:Uncharacterized protein n=1 Tax=Lupinus luteus TaxID=3873 RepID=A0AAV1Y3C9_LUPLU